MWSFYLPSFSQLCLFSSSLGIVPKKDPSEFRIIQQLSYPHGTSANDNIPDAHSSVHYASISDAIAVLKSLGAGCFLAKTDIESAFRIIPIHPSNFPLFGMTWDNQFYFDVCLPMGLSSSCQVFEACSSSLEWISVHRFDASGVLHILDDILFIARTEEQCRTDLNNFLRMCIISACPLLRKKLVGHLMSYNLQVSHSIQLIRKLVCRKISFKKLCRLLLESVCKRRIKLLCENYSP